MVAYKRGIAHLLLIILVAIVVLAVPMLIAKFIFNKKIGFGKKEPNVALKTEYKNPFDKKTQYVNPFEESKNPFANINE